jgi:hypothetical protein
LSGTDRGHQNFSYLYENSRVHDAKVKASRKRSPTLADEESQDTKHRRRTADSTE